MKYFLLSCFCLISGSLLAQNPGEDELMKDIFDYRSQTDTIDIKRHQFRKGELVYLQSEFSPKEYACLISQLENAPEIWNNKLSGKAIITHINKGNKFYRYSTPLFTSDGQFALYVKEYHCGNLCAEGRIIMLQKTKEGWIINNKKLKTAYYWES